MSKLEKTLKDYASLAIEWREFSKNTAGWTTEEYAKPGVKVRCYFAVGSTHTDTTFYINGSELIGVALFHPAQLEFEVDSMNLLIASYEKFKTFLEECKNEQAVASIAEKQQARKDEIANLKRRLKEISSEQN